MAAGNICLHEYMFRRNSRILNQVKKDSKAAAWVKKCLKIKSTQTNLLVLQRYDVGIKWIEIIKSCYIGL